jgi:hypothetical protein
MQIKIIPSIFMLLCYTYAFAQEATEIYLFDLIESGKSFTIKNGVNISDQKGYDNQPSFTEDGASILFTSFRDGQADIAIYDIDQQYRGWLTNTPENEISPMAYPGKKKLFTCIRSDNKENQQLFTYSFKGNEPKLLIGDVKLAYYTWFDKNTLVTYELGDMDALYVNNFKLKIKYPLQQDTGRSFQRKPGTVLIGFISQIHEEPEIYSMDIKTSKLTYLADALEKSMDMAFTNNGTVLMASANKIYKFRPEEDKEWKNVPIESELPLNNITRLAISPDGKKIAVVVAE